MDEEHLETRSGSRPVSRGLRAVSALGALAFLSALGAAVFSPGALEMRAHDFIVERVTVEVDERFSQLDSTATSGPLGALSELLSDRADTLRVALNAGLSAALTDVLANLCHYECAPTDSLESMVREAGEARVSLLQRASGRAWEWAQGRYSESVVELVEELRIFTGINAALFLLVLAASFAAPPNAAPARLTLWLLVFSTVASILGYVFIQDWFYSFVYGSYVGYGYALWVSLIFALLLDWVFLRGRITEGILNVIGGTASSLG